VLTTYFRQLPRLRRSKALPLDVFYTTFVAFNGATSPWFGLHQALRHENFLISSVALFDAPHLHTQIQSSLFGSTRNLCLSDSHAPTWSPKQQTVDTAHSDPFTKMSGNIRPFWRLPQQQPRAAKVPGIVEQRKAFGDESNMLAGSAVYVRCPVQSRKSHINPTLRMATRLY